ncbi:small GTP-binding protein [Leptolyngbya sp. NIES-3755]|nr:small GTP-binding protein [Leptolyngbya sp. NIES-3755]
MRDLIFISYSHKDKKWLTALRTMLKPLEKKLPVEVWDDTRIRTGQQWRSEIAQALDRACVAILLVSPDFLASDFIAEHELPPLLKAAEQGGLVVVSLHISHSLYDETEIEKYQAINDPTQTLDLLNPGERNRLLVRVCREIKALALLSQEPTDF